MKQFTKLFRDLDQTNSTIEKVKLLEEYFRTADADDKIWALAIFTGRRPPRIIKTTQVQEWAAELAGIPMWLFKESYNNVGDLGETISLIIPGNGTNDNRPLADWFMKINQLRKEPDEVKKSAIIEMWLMLDAQEKFVFNKLLMGSLRIGVSQTLVTKAIANISGKEAAWVTHRIMGDWKPGEISFEELIFGENAASGLSQPYPFYLAYDLERELHSLGEISEWSAEWKWDGIRTQLIYRNNQRFIWSRGEELITDKFPELQAIEKSEHVNFVLDGELLCWKDNRPLPFGILQTRIARKKMTPKILADAPVVFMAYDLLEWEGIDFRNRAYEERRILLQKLIHELNDPVFKFSNAVNFNSWEHLTELRKSSREVGTEGFMLKKKESPYLAGRKKGDWWKWKVDPYSIDAVLIYAQKGHGRRAGLYTDYTFAVWDKDRLVSFAKAYSGLTDKEISEVDQFVKANTLERFGPVATVVPELVFEIGFEGIQASTRHKSGIAVRFPRILKFRFDKKAAEAGTIEQLKELLAGYA